MAEAQIVQAQQPQLANGADGEGVNKFKLAWQMSTKLAESDIIPAVFKNKPANVMIAMQVSQAIGMPILPVMQNLYIVGGKPAWMAQWVISILNSSGKFTDLRWKEWNDEKKGLSCVCYATDKTTGEKLESIPITMEMAKRETWTNNKKWESMPEQMLRYRSAAFFARAYAPHLLNGMYTVEEVEEMPVERFAVIDGMNRESYPESAGLIETKPDPAPESLRDDAAFNAELLEATIQKIRARKMSKPGVEKMLSERYGKVDINALTGQELTDLSAFMDAEE